MREIQLRKSCTDALAHNCCAMLNKYQTPEMWVYFTTLLFYLFLPIHFSFCSSHRGSYKIRADVVLLKHPNGFGVTGQLWIWGSWTSAQCSEMALACRTLTVQESLTMTKQTEVQNSWLICKNNKLRHKLLL